VVSWTGAANDIAYLIYSCSGASCTPTLHAVMPHAGAPGATAESYRDFGHSFGTDEDFGTAIRSSAAAQVDHQAINGVKVEGALPPQYFDQAIAYELQHASSK